MKQSPFMFVPVTREHDKYKCNEVGKPFTFWQDPKLDDAFPTYKAHALTEVLCDSLQPYLVHVEAGNGHIQNVPPVGHLVAVVSKPKLGVVLYWHHGDDLRW